MACVHMFVGTVMHIQLLHFHNEFVSRLGSSLISKMLFCGCATRAFELAFHEICVLELEFFELAQSS